MGSGGGEPQGPFDRLDGSLAEGLIIGVDDRAGVQGLGVDDLLDSEANRRPMEADGSVTRVDERERVARFEQRDGAWPSHAYYHSREMLNDVAALLRRAGPTDSLCL